MIQYEKVTKKKKKQKYTYSHIWEDNKKIIAKDDEPQV